MNRNYKVGDIIIFNNKANVLYSITREGCVAKIMKIENSSFICAEIIKDSPIKHKQFKISCIGEVYEVRAECFDLLLSLMLKLL